MYIIFGMPERDDDNSSKVYNSVTIIHPGGKTEKHRKLHLPFSEGNWAVRGEYPVLIETPWGPVGLAICYDTYCFPELIRYYSAKGARLFLNVTACPEAECSRVAAKLTIPAYAYVNYTFIATSNLCGRDKTSWFIGGSYVIGPRKNSKGAGEPYTNMGKMFDTHESNNPEMHFGTIDLPMADANTDIPIYSVNPGINEPDFMPELHKRMNEDLLSTGAWAL